MRLIESIAGLGECRPPLSLAIGVFDGVHTGHQAVIGDAVKRAQAHGGEAVVVTFVPHPQRILRPQEEPKLLTPTPHKIRILQRSGVANLLLIPFTREFSLMEPEEFLHALAAACGPHGLASISVGRTWCFGRDRKGDLDLLRRVGAELGFEVAGISEVIVGGLPVSSTRIRALIKEGALDEAAALLGRPVSVFGTVVAGDCLGHKLGFPTANISVQSEQLPPTGVYVAAARIHNEPMPAVANLGYRPTMARGNPSLAFEVHILDFSANLYGVPLEVDLLCKLREEKKFDSEDALRTQIQSDVAAAREIHARRLVDSCAPCQYRAT